MLQPHRFAVIASTVAVFSTLFVATASADDKKPAASQPAIQRPALGEIEVGDYCSVLLAPKLRAHLGANDAQNEKFTQMLTELKTRMDNSGSGYAGPMGITPGLISARIRLQMAEFGRNVRDLLTPEQDRALVDMFNQKVLTPIQISATVDRSRPRFGPNAGKVYQSTGYNLSYTHYGEDGDAAKASAPLPTATTTPTANTPTAHSSHSRTVRPNRPGAGNAPVAAAVAVSVEDPLPAGRTLRIPTRNPVRHMAVSANGKLLVTAEDQIIRVWDISTGIPADVDELDAQTAHTGNMNAIALSPDARLLAIGCQDNSVRLYELGTEGFKKLDTQISHDRQVFSVAFSPDGKSLYSGADDMNVICWSLNAGRLEEKSRCKIGSIFGIKCLAIQSPQLVTCSTGTGDVSVIDFAATPPTVTSSYKVPPCPFVLPMALSPDGSTLLFGSGKEVRLKAAEMRSFNANTKENKCVAWSPDSKYFATGTEDGHLMVWDASGKIRFDYPRPQRFNEVAFIPTADHTELLVAGANDDCDIYILHLKTSAAGIKK